MLDIGYLWIFNRPPGWIHHGQRRQKGRQADLGRKGVARHVAQLHGAQAFLLAATAQRGENVEKTWRSKPAPGDIHGKIYGIYGNTMNFANIGLERD